MTKTPSKLIYLAKRNPKLSHEQFIRRWRQHGALAMQQTFFSSIERYAHCDTINPPAGLAASTEYDGIGICWFRDLNPFLPEERERMRKDELATFSEYVSYSVLMCSESVLKPGRGLVKVSAFVVRRKGTTHSSFAKHWREVHGPMLLAQEHLKPYLVGYVQNPVVVNDRMRDSRLQFDGVTEFYFHNPEQMGRFFSEVSKREELNRDSAEFLDRERTQLVVTDEVMLYDSEVATVM